MFLIDFDGQEAIIEPRKVVARVEGMPKTCIGVFSHVPVEACVAKYKGEVISLIQSACGDRPVYKIVAGRHEFALFVPNVGAPGAVGCMEELVAKGAENFIFCGSCGVLRHDIADGHLIVPTAAIRDEGVSFHYAQASDEISVDAENVGLVTGVLETLGLPFVTGKTWTTDAFFRETPRKMSMAKEMGAICVEMECASLAAAARFRGVSFMQFLWAADDLDTPEWDRRGLAEKGASVSEKCMFAAIELAKICAER